MSENGFLTERDKKFLRGEKEYSGKNARQMRYQVRRTIRRRTRAAFRDFSLLYATLDEDERKKIFRVSDDPLDTDGGLSRETRQGVTDMLAFLYLSLVGRVDEEFSRLTQPGVPKFESALERAISQAEHDRRPDDAGVGPFVSTELTVDVSTNVDVAAAAEKLARGDTWRLSEAELRALVQTAYDNTNDYALEPLIDEKRKELGMDPDEIRADVQEWFNDTHVSPDNTE
jgi:hypothetical protein